MKAQPYGTSDNSLHSTTDPQVIADMIDLDQPSITRSADAGATTEVRVSIESSADIITARQQGRFIAASVGFSASDLTIIATAISEVARNIVEYAGTGEVTIATVKDRSRSGVQIVVRDAGPGIADVALVMRDGFSSGNGLGIGLPGARRLMDDFDISSTLGHGTTITMKKWL
jgi:serine/threonine-protein kinase RsbT